MINILKGILTALATLVPGVSGGTMMIVLNVYDQTIEAMSQAISGKLVHFKMMVQLVIGGLIGIVFFSSSIEKAIIAYPLGMSFLFLGIIIAGIFAFIDKIEWSKFKPIYTVYLISGLGIALVTNYLNSSSMVSDVSGFQYILLVLISGVIIAVALILPGISTSFLLLSLGMYDDTLRAFSTMDISYLLPLVIGVVFGLLVTTKVLEYLLKNHTTPTYLLILGFVVGSIGSIFPGLPPKGQWLSLGSMFILGVILMTLLQIWVNKYPSKDD